MRTNTLKKIYYVKGDATNPQTDGNKIICHICNDVGAWGAGFVLALSKKWKQPEIAYRNMKKRPLGHVDFIRVTPEIMVANMIAQHDIKPDVNGNPPIKYGAVRIALNEVNKMAFQTDSTIHMPRIGCGLAGGKWDEIEQIIKDVMSVDIYVYDLK